MGIANDTASFMTDYYYWIVIIIVDDSVAFSRNLFLPLFLRYVKL